MKTKSLAPRASLWLAAALLLGSLAACNPSVPHQGDDDGGIDAAIPDSPDAGPDAANAPDAAPADAGTDAPPQSSAIELLSGGGQASSGSLTLDVQIGIPTAGASADGARDLTTAPVLR